MSITSFPHQYKTPAVHRSQSQNHHWWIDSSLLVCERHVSCYRTPYPPSSSQHRRANAAHMEHEPLAPGKWIWSGTATARETESTNEMQTATANGEWYRGAQEQKLGALPWLRRRPGRSRQQHRGPNCGFRGRRWLLLWWKKWSRKRSWWGRRCGSGLELRSPFRSMEVAVISSRRLLTTSVSPALVKL